MFAPTEFDGPKPPRQMLPQERAVGLAALLLFTFVCLVFSVSADAELFNPYNTMRAQTAVQTRTTTPGAPRSTAGVPLFAPDHPTATPRGSDLRAQQLPMPATESETRPPAE